MACCIGAPLALNIDSILSPFGAIILFLVITFHLLAFIAGYYFTGFFFSKAPDVKPLQRTLSYETGMQSSLLALALATKFFQDPLVGVPPAISVSFKTNPFYYLPLLLIMFIFIFHRSQFVYFFADSGYVSDGLLTRHNMEKQKGLVT